MPEKLAPFYLGVYLESLCRAGLRLRIYLNLPELDSASYSQACASRCENCVAQLGGKCSGMDPTVGFAEIDAVNHVALYFMREISANCISNPIACTIKHTFETEPSPIES